jgi:hypothetical protein
MHWLCENAFYDHHNPVRAQTIDVPNASCLLAPMLCLWPTGGEQLDSMMQYHRKRIRRMEAPRSENQSTTYRRHARNTRSRSQVDRVSTD